MFKFNPQTGVPGFRVGLTEDPPGFAIEPDGSVRRAIPGTPSAPAFGYDPNGNALQTTAPPPAFNPAGMLYTAGSGLYPITYPPYVRFAGGLPSQDPLLEKSDRAANFYADVGVNPLSFPDPQGLSANPTAPVGSGSPPQPQAASPAPPESTVSEGFLQPDPQGDSGRFTLAGYGASDPLNRADAAGTTPNPVQNTSGDDGFQLIRSAQAQTPQVQTAKDTSPGEVVVLPDGSTIPHPESPTGKLMAPVADLSAVAAAGRRTGFAHRAMLFNSLTALGAPAWMVANLYANVSHGGTFDYQRRGGQFLGQFTPVSNVNVGLFAQQAGLSLEETLAIAGLYARLFSSNAIPGEPYGLNPNQMKFITAGFKIGQSGVFGAPATP